MKPMAKYALPIGPIHPALDEPLYFRFEMEGETIKNTEIMFGHVHRGMEKLAMTNTISQNVILCERTCGLCSSNHGLSYCRVMETIGDIKVPERAEYIRVITDELKRIASHAFAVALIAHVIGFDTLFLYAFQEREKVLDLIEAFTGNRFHTSVNVIGGVKRDIDEELANRISKDLEEFKHSWEKVAEIYSTDPNILSRTKNVGVLTKEKAIEYGTMGPIARASGIAFDVRKQSPYLVYDELDFKLITETSGDVYARTMVRIREIFESINLIQQCIKRMPKGPINLGLIPRIPPGEASVRTEAPRGELIYYARTNGTQNPVLVKWRVPSVVNLPSLVEMFKENKIADIPVIVASIDPCISCTER
ncbi:Ech-type complex subunit Ech1E [Thermoanaerobacter kivui]|uniref:Ech-type complex subunit Ech1E n=1 Tax=Thermoanaerobacter kivui TaxID=2325 RepID=A0A097ANE0_THEKI|nr:Ech-type complex subunit Ech1E [Thermoanaerobacter kivui]